MIANFIDGPLWYFSLAVFVIASLWKLIAIVARGRPRNLAKPHYRKRGGALATILRRFVPYREFRKVSRVQLYAGYAFHLGLLALLFFAAPHVEFNAERITGFAWTPMPHWAFVLAAELALGGLLFLLLYRLMNPVTRYLSSRGDYLASGLVFLVMLTGCFALWRSHESAALDPPLSRGNDAALFPVQLADARALLPSEPRVHGCRLPSEGSEPVSRSKPNHPEVC